MIKELTHPPFLACRLYLKKSMLPEFTVSYCILMFNFFIFIYLERDYSSCVIESLSKKELLKDNHLDFLINEYVKELELDALAFTGCTFKAIEKRIALVGNVSYNLFKY